MAAILSGIKKHVLIKESLYIKQHKPSINQGLKAKEIRLFYRQLDDIACLILP